MLRERVTTPLARFFVTQGEAGGLLQGSSPFRAINTDNIVENAMLRFQPDTPAYRVGQELVATGGSFLIPEVELQQSKPPGTAPGGGGGQSSGGGQSIVTPTQYRVAGAGLFKSGRLVGWLSPAATRGALWLLGTATRGTVTVKTPKGSTVTLLLASAHIQRRAVLRDGRPTVVIDIVAAGVLRNVQGAALHLERPATTNELDHLMGQAIQDRAQLSLQQAQSMGVDAFGFGRLIAAYGPTAWRSMAATWPEGFARVPVSIRVKGTVRFTGNLINGPSPSATARRAGP